MVDADVEVDMVVVLRLGVRTEPDGATEESEMCEEDSPVEASEV